MFKDKQSYVYILASKKNGAIYIGSTTDLITRIWQHKNGIVAKHTDKYWIKRLVYYEVCPDLESALLREKRMKKWNRAWKIRLIEENNPSWTDLYKRLF